MKWLHYSLLCGCHSSSVVASPSLVSILRAASALSCQKMAKLYWHPSSTLMLIYSEWLWCYGIVWKHHHLPSPPRPPHRLPIYFSICKGKWNQSRSGVFLGAKFISNVDGAKVGLCHDCPKQSNPDRGAADWSGAALSIIITITLKDLHWQREESQEGLWVLAVQIAPPVDRPWNKQQIVSEQMTAVHANAYDKLITVTL